MKEDYEWVKGSWYGDARLVRKEVDARVIYRNERYIVMSNGTNYRYFNREQWNALTSGDLSATDRWYYGFDVTELIELIELHKNLPNPKPHLTIEALE